MATADRLTIELPVTDIVIFAPRPLRDMLHHFVARNRYAWFGKADSYLAPTPELSATFIHD